MLLGGVSFPSALYHHALLESKFPAEALCPVLRGPKGAGEALCLLAAQLAVQRASVFTQQSTGFCRGGSREQMCASPSHLLLLCPPGVLLLSVLPPTPVYRMIPSTHLSLPACVHVQIPFPHIPQPPRNLSTTGSNLFLFLALTAFLPLTSVMWQSFWSTCPVLKRSGLIPQNRH